MKKFFPFTVLAAVVLSLNACNTYIGLGRDIQGLGEGIQNTGYGKGWKGEQYQPDQEPAQ